MDNTDLNGNNPGKRTPWKWIAVGVVVILVGGIVYFATSTKKASVNKPTDIEQSTSEPSTNVAGSLVEIKNSSFAPSSLFVKVGDTVTWVNKDSVGHSIIADDGSFNIGVLAQGQSSSTVFSKAGTFSYHCGVHPTMKGTIVVQ